MQAETETFERGVTTLTDILTRQSARLEERGKNLREEIGDFSRSLKGLIDIRQSLLVKKMEAAGVVPCELGFSHGHQCGTQFGPDLPHWLMHKDNSALLFVHRHQGDRTFPADVEIDMEEGESKTMWVCRGGHLNNRYWRNNYSLAKALPLPRDGQIFGPGSLIASAIAPVIQRGEQYIAIDGKTELVVPAPRLDPRPTYPEDYYKHFNLPSLPKAPAL